jgi:hypothetical protein
MEYIGIDISEQYIQMTKDRIKNFVYARH